MKKTLTRVLILFTIFLGSLIFFYNQVSEHSFSAEVTTATTSSASLPIISFAVNGNEINQTKGYTVLQDETYPRESITPISTAKNLSIYIKEKGSSVKLLSADVFDVASLNTVSHYETNVLQKMQDGRLMADVTIEEQMTENVEYLLRVTLTTSMGERAYYYTRLKVSGFGSLTESLAFINNFHECTLDKDKVYELKDVMESKDDIITNYSHIDITANLDALSYGEMIPAEVYRYVPQITEYNENYVSATLRFWISAETENGGETFECKENYRFQYSSYKTFLYNYDRTMETCFDGEKMISADSGLRFGITENRELDSIYSEDGNQLLFSRQGTLWHFDMESNRIVEVLSYNDNDYDRNGDEEYDYELLSIDDEGNADFAVYGYIGKGVYEGRIGIIYYHYYAKDARIEELMFIPVNVEFGELEGEFGRVSYTTEQNIYFFTLFDAFYSYELNTNVLKTEVPDLGYNWLYFEKENLICYNENSDEALNNRIILHDVANNKDTYIEATQGSAINLLGTVDNRIVYGIGDPALVSFYDDGRTFLPLKEVVIADIDTTIVKEYKTSEGKYVGDVSFEQGVINLDLYTLISESDGESKALLDYTDNDIIINLNKNAETIDTLTGRTNAITGMEFFFALPESYLAESSPEKSETKSTVIKVDTSALIKTEKESRFHVTAYGDTVMTTDMLGEALRCADSVLGTIVDNKGNVLWQRGIVNTSKTIDGVSVSYANDGRSAEQAVIQMLMDYCGVAGDASEFNMREKSMYDWLKESVGDSVALVRGASLGQVLYFVSEGHPVIAPLEDYYVVITEYTSDKVAYLDPVTGKKITKSKTAAEEQFLEAGGTYYVY